MADGANDDAREGRAMGRPRLGARPRREAILDAALAAFVARGVDAATMGEVAAGAGASKTTLYRLFPDMDALFAAVLAREVARRRGAIAAALEARDLEDALRGAAHAMLDALDAGAVELFRLAVAEGGRRPEVARGFYDSLVASAAHPIAVRLAAELEEPLEEARLRALQFVGAVKEPLFYPRLMGITPTAEQRGIVERAVMMIHAAWTRDGDGRSLGGAT